MATILYTEAQRNRGDEPAALLYLHPSSEQVLLAVEPTAISAAESLTGTTVATLLHPPHAYAYLSGRVVALRAAEGALEVRSAAVGCGGAVVLAAVLAGRGRSGGSLWERRAAPTGSRGRSGCPAPPPPSSRRRRAAARTRSRSRRRVRCSWGAGSSGQPGHETRRRNARSRVRSSSTRRCPHRRRRAPLGGDNRARPVLGATAATAASGYRTTAGALRAGDGDGDGDSAGAPAGGGCRRRRPRPSSRAPQRPRWRRAAAAAAAARRRRRSRPRLADAGVRRAAQGCILTASTSSGAALVALCTWGRGDGGRLGHGTPCVDVVTPKLVAALTGEKVRQLAMGTAHTVALCEGAEGVRVLAWGSAAAAGGVGGGGVPALDCAVPRPLPLPRAPLHVVVAGGRTLVAGS